ncbi:hypothetical protein HFP57_07630 [Parasphingopyxis algicola]|uniref:hypothetical protein n=1 Tax=Parasphingopyxis algicola TaxID=2026624 RepID=UPI0015A0B59E|nr:hypothetical protein [Parasphingopyxis algicola]QLC24912.1 hypothetical protein HFP57_07630 [Parasphingopyxis algicola]
MTAPFVIRRGRELTGSVRNAIETQADLVEIDPALAEAVADRTMRSATKLG